MNKFVGLAICLGIFVTATHASDRFSECVAVAKDTNRYLPQGSKFVNAEVAACLPGPNRPILWYRMRFLPQGVPVEYEMTDIKKALIESWCTSPGQRALLKWLDIKYDYFANNGAFAASIRFGLEDCKN